jgi:catechol 2,3-dioxygenase
VSFIATDGSAHSGLEPLDVDQLLRELDNTSHVETRLAADAFIGHIHMRARSPETLMAFYLGVLGFKPHVQSRSFGLFDCGTDQRRHMVAFNIWARDGLREPPPGAAGLEHFTVVLPSGEDMAAVAQRLSDANLPANLRKGTLDLADPEGNRLQVVAADN